MSKQKTEYNLLVERVFEVLAGTPEELQKWVELSENYLEAASNMTKDEIALIEAYLKRDVYAFGESYQQAKQNTSADAAFRSVIANSLWEKLADITDKTQLEWHEVMRDIEHHGVYRAGEIVGLGALKCERCGHQVEYYHVDVLGECIKCGGKEFSRKML